MPVASLVAEHLGETGKTGTGYISDHEIGRFSLADSVTRSRIFLSANQTWKHNRDLTCLNYIINTALKKLQKTSLAD